MHFCFGARKTSQLLSIAALALTVAVVLVSETLAGQNDLAFFGDRVSKDVPDIARRQDIELVAKKIIHTLTAPFELGGAGQSVEIGTSIGIAVYPTDGKDADALVKAADTAMYAAKQTRNCCRFSGESGSEYLSGGAISKS